MAIHGNFTRANYDALIAATRLREQLNIPSSATFDEVNNFWGTIDNLDLRDLYQSDVDTALNWIEEIDGFLYAGTNNSTLSRNSLALKNFNFLSNLTRIGGSLFLNGSSNNSSIYDAGKINDISGLSSLAEIGGGLRISYTAVRNLDGLSSLQRVGMVPLSTLTINSNRLLTSIAGLKNATIRVSASTNATINYNPVLTSLDGLQGLTSELVRNYTVGGETVSLPYFRAILLENNALTSLEGLPDGFYIQWFFYIQNNNLENLYAWRPAWLLRNSSGVQCQNAFSDAAFQAEGSFNQFGCAPNDANWHDALVDDGYSFYISLWDLAYPQGRSDCDTPINPDVTPDAFTFSDITNAGVNAFVESETITLAGFDNRLSLRVAGARNIRVSINGAAYVAVANQLLSAGDTIQLQAQAPGMLNLTEGINVAVGLTSTRWRISTAENIGPSVDNPLDTFRGEVDDIVNIDVTNVFSDPEGHELTYELQGAPPSLDVKKNTDGTVVIEGELTLDDLGEWEIQFIANDHLNARAVDYFTFKVDVNRDDINQTITRVDEIVQKEEEVEDKVDQAEADILALTNRVTTNEQAISTLQTEIQAVASADDLSELSESHNTLSSLVTGLESSVDTLTLSDTTLGNRITALENAPAPTVDFSAVNMNIATLETKVNQHRSYHIADVEAIESRITRLEAVDNASFVTNAQLESKVENIVLNTVLLSPSNPDESITISQIPVNLFGALSQLNAAVAQINRYQQEIDRANSLIRDLQTKVADLMAGN